MGRIKGKNENSNIYLTNKTPPIHNECQKYLSLFVFGKYRNLAEELFFLLCCYSRYKKIFQNMFSSKSMKYREKYIISEFKKSLNYKYRYFGSRWYPTSDKARFGSHLVHHQEPNSSQMVGRTLLPSNANITAKSLYLFSIVLGWQSWGPGFDSRWL